MAIVPDTKGTIAPTISRGSEAPVSTSKPPAAPAVYAETRPAEKPAGGGARRGRRRNVDKTNSGEAGTTVRFFTGDRNSSSATPSLTKEHPSEGEALLASLKADVPYFRVEIWTARPSFVGDGKVGIEKAPVK
jgi:hypothetical protein